MDKEELYTVRFLSMNSGSSVMKNQEAMLRQQGVSWTRCTVDMVSLLHLILLEENVMSF